METFQGILLSLAKIIGSPHVDKAVDNLPLALSTQGNESCSTGRRDMIVGQSAGSNLSGENAASSTQGNGSCSTGLRDRNLIVCQSAGANLSGTQGNETFSTGRRDMIVGQSAGSNLSGEDAASATQCPPQLICVYIRGLLKFIW